MPGLEWGWTLASWPLVRAFVAVAEASSRSNSGRPVSGKSPSAGGRLVEWLRGWRSYPSAVLGTVGFRHGGLVVGRVGMEVVVKWLPSSRQVVVRWLPSGYQL